MMDEAAPEPTALTPGNAMETAVADAAGLAQLVLGEHERSALGARAASRSGQWAWALYEAARDPNVLFSIYVISPFFATVMIDDPVRGQILWGDITSYSGYLTALLAPFFGAIADKGGPRKPWLALFSVLLVLSFAGTWFGVPHSSATQIAIVGVMVALNNIVFELSNAFHGAMLPSIAPAARIGRLSGVAYALGTGSGVILLTFFFIGFVAPGQIHGLLIPSHALFGVNPSAHEPERLSGPISAVWMLAFAIPLFLLVPDRPRGGLGWRGAMRSGIGSVVRTVRSLFHYRNIAHYLAARTLFNDGMTGVLTFSGIYAAGTFGWGALVMTLFGINISVFAMLGGFLGGFLDDRFGSKKALLISIGGTALSFGLSLTMGPDRILWFIPADAGHVYLNAPPFAQTLPQAIYTVLIDFTAMCITAGYANSRTMMARLAPAEKMTEFFGLMSLSGTAATFIAPMSVALLTSWTHSQRGGMIAVVSLLVAGFIWLFWVKEERAALVD